MKKTLLFTKKSKLSIALFAFCLCFNLSWGQELVLNGTADEHGTGADTSNTSDNADAWDITPNSTLNGGITSPYRAIWNNTALGTWLEDTYNSGSGVDEQPGSTSSGNGGTRGVKLYGDGSPVVSESTRRLYQLVEGLTIGDTYDFSIDSRSEASGTPSEVYILNTEIADETGINTNGYSDSSVVTGVDITNDEGAWTTTTFSFTATTTSVVIYVRALAANSGDTEVFYDNISLMKNTTASLDDVFASNVSIYPNPASEFVTISSSVEINKIEVYNLLGKKVVSTEKLINNTLDISNLSKGMYVLKLTSDGATATKKIVKI